jgi:hypothetical protein
VAGESSDTVHNIVDKKVQRQKPINDIEGDLNIELESIKLPSNIEKRIASSLHRIDETNEHP